MGLSNSLRFASLQDLCHGVAEVWAVPLTGIDLLPVDVHGTVREAVYHLEAAREGAGRPVRESRLDSSPSLGNLGPQTAIGSVRLGKQRLSSSNFMRRVNFVGTHCRNFVGAHCRFQYYMQFPSAATQPTVA